ncbi:hypothetical protein CGMCC3_g10779 [Colletotrichum fructicola]|nr:uncharacterized protein CGMCC3_g10779 [Colletotrichum fructicola]KAE9573082.1 hypothetical protein CGMCC3_g10779 [Colletotrichum fructicola]
MHDSFRSLYTRDIAWQRITAFDSIKAIERHRLEFAAKTDSQVPAYTEIKLLCRTPTTQDPNYLELISNLAS